jgi:N-acetylneuraminic acid mutarotase
MFGSCHDSVNRAPNRRVGWPVLVGTLRSGRIFPLAAAAVGLGASFFGLQSAGHATPDAAVVGSWKRAAPMLHRRSAHAVVSTGAAIYAIGGSGVNGPVLDVERFDGTRWVDETRLPGDGLNAPAAAFLNGRIYVIGGFEALGNRPTDKMLIYDVASRSWSEGPSLPAPRGGHAAVVLGGKIHVLGGGNSQSTIAAHSVFDPATSKWSELKRVRRAKGSVAAVVFAGRIVAVGGRSGSFDFGDVDVYDAARNAWSRGPRIGARGTSGAAVYRGGLYVFGGESQIQAKTLSAVMRLASLRSTWRRVSKLPTARNYARAVVFKDAVYVVGGSRVAGDSHGAAGGAIVERFFIRR